MPPYAFPELHTGNGTTLNSATFFLNKSDRISLEISWLLKFDIWRVSISINCNFFRYVNQVSHRNNQSFPFFKFLTWYEVCYLSSDIPLPTSTNIPLTEQVDLWHMSYTKNDIWSANYTFFFTELNDVIYCLILSRVITEPNFNSVLGTEIKSYGGAYPISFSNHLFSTHNRLSMFCSIWYHLCNFKNVKKTCGGVLLLVTLLVSKVTLLHKCFSRFLDCTNGTKSCKTSHQNLLSIRENWKIVGSKFSGKLKIDGNLVAKSKVPPRSGSVALRQLNPIHKKEPQSFSFFLINTVNKTHSEE